MFRGFCRSQGVKEKEAKAEITETNICIMLCYKPSTPVKNGDTLAAIHVGMIPVTENARKCPTKFVLLNTSTYKCKCKKTAIS